MPPAVPGAPRCVPFFLCPKQTTASTTIKQRQTPRNIVCSTLTTTTTAGKHRRDRCCRTELLATDTESCSFSTMLLQKRRTSVYAFTKYLAAELIVPQSKLATALDTDHGTKRNGPIAHPLGSGLRRRARPGPNCIFCP